MHNSPCHLLAVTLLIRAVLCRLAAHSSGSDRLGYSPVAYAFWGSLAAYACYASSPAALAEADVTVRPSARSINKSRTKGHILRSYA